MNSRPLSDRVSSTRTPQFPCVWGWMMAPVAVVLSPENCVPAPNAVAFGRSADRALYFPESAISTFSPEIFTFSDFCIPMR